MITSEAGPVELVLDATRSAGLVESVTTRSVILDATRSNNFVTTRSVGSAYPTIGSSLPSSVGILDSGCSTTTLKDREFFTSVMPVDRKIQTADNDSNITVEYVGPVPPFYEVNYLPNCHTNLISLSDLDDLGVSMTISNGDLSCIFNGQTIFVCTKHDSLWKVQVHALLKVLRNTFGNEATANWLRDHNADGENYVASSVKKAEEFLYLWHLRLFHRNAQDLVKAILQKKIVIQDSTSYGLLYSTKLAPNVCESCCKSKSHALPKPAAKSGPERPPLKRSKRISEGSSSRIVKVTRSDKNQAVSISTYGEKANNPHGFKSGMVSTDLTGPFQVKTLKGSYIGNQVFLELDSKWAYTFFYRNKSDSMENLRKLVDFHLKRQRLDLTHYHSDGARELCGREPQDYLASIGCTSTWIAADTPQENSISERHFRTEYEQSHASMLYARYLPKSLWNFAKEAFNHVYNRFPTNTTRGWISPYEFKYGKLPDVSYLRIWGSKCFANIALSHRRKNWAPKAQVGYLMGYSELQRDAYKIWVPETNRIIISRSVIFDEAIPQGDVDFSKDTFWREVRQFAKRVTAKKMNLEDFYYLVDLIFYDPDIDSECIVKEVLISNTFIVAEYKQLKDGVEVGKLTRIHVADVENLLGVQLPDDLQGADDEDAGLEESNVLRASALLHEHSDSAIYASKEIPGTVIPSRTNEYPIHRVAVRTDVVGSAFPPGEHLGQDNTPKQVEGRLEHFDNRQCVEPFANEFQHLIARDDSLCSWAEVPHNKGALYSFVNQYMMYSDPVTYSEALQGANAEQWKQAIATEVSNITDRGVVIEVPKPHNSRNVMGSRFVFKTKMKHGVLDKFKARLVAKGYTQVKDLDYNETFAPVARMNTLRIFLKLSVDLGHVRVSIDFVAAFLNSNVSEELYMEAPDGWDIKPGHVLKLVKSLYGIKQAGRNWRNLIHDYLVQIERFVVCLSEHCVYTKDNGSIMVILYVDDMIISSKNPQDTADLIARLKEHFDIGEEGPLTWYLGMSIEDKGTSLKLSQRDYINKMLVRYNYEDLREEPTPMIEKYQIDKDPDDEFYEDFDLRSKIGSLMFASVCTRPDISFAVGYLARFTNHPSKQVCNAITRIFQYLKGTSSLGIMIKAEDGARPVVYCDADFAGDTIDYKSTSGVLAMIGSTPVCWYSSKQTTTAQSTTDSEIISMNTATKEIIWIRNLIREIGLSIVQPTKLLCDSKSAIMLAHNPVFHKRTKHIMVKFQFLIETLKADEAILEHVKSALNLADGLTKALGITHFRTHRDLINLR